VEVPLCIIITCYTSSIYNAASESSKQQYRDNCRWIREAGKHQLVVGSQARILYANEQGRKAIALAFNKAIAEGKLKVGDVENFHFLSKSFCLLGKF
jgi:urocanate hydratase